MKFIIWEVIGYKGRNNYDGEGDNNFNIKVAMDYRFSQNDVEEIFFNRFSKKHRTVALKAKKIKEMNI